MSWVVRAPERELSKPERKLYTRVRRELWDYEPLRASHAEIFIDVAGDQVGLRGRVRTMPQKIIAEMLVRRMTDVGSVSNELIADTEVIRSVADALAQDERTAPYVIRVDARHGIVSLRGEVPSEALSGLAAEVAAQAPLVSSVRNQLSIGGEVQAAVALARPSPAADVPNLDATPVRA
ncbi:MAG TPA: BON domain-containing protein [Chloroflexota bacterium]|nr:BON domain-containing protein [Chloroflexota bacterium]